MPDELEVVEITQDDKETVSTALVGPDLLKQESAKLLNEVINTTDQDKIKDLTYLFNQNQTKKTMLRLDKLNELQDKLVDKTLDRINTHPENLTTQELLQGLKVVQDSIERSQNQIMGSQEKPLIQINQQTNEVNIGPEGRSKESRDRISNAVMNFLNQISPETAQATEIIENVEEITDGD